MLRSSHPKCITKRFQHHYQWSLGLNSFLKPSQLCVGSLLCQEGFPDHFRGFSSLGKNQTLSILAVLRGHNGLMWLAVRGALACLLLEHVVAASFAS